MTKLLSEELQPLTQGFTVFDQMYCPRMMDHPYYSKLVGKSYDRYRSLPLVWNTEICEDKYSSANTLLIDSDDNKVQLCLENAIVDRPYDLKDI